MATTNLIVSLHNTQEIAYKTYLVHTFFFQRPPTQDVIILTEYTILGKKRQCFSRALILSDQPSNW